MKRYQIFIIISQTGTLLSRILKFVTKAEYNHASISLSADLERMYSFGRRHPYNPFWGGFVVESPHFGTFKRFSKTKVVVLSVDISEETYTQVHNMLQNMCKEAGKYHYNYLGLGLAAFHIQRRKENCYYCSEFVKEVLLRYRIKGASQLQPIVQPIHFLDLSYRPVYRGRLRDYVYPGAF